MTNTNKSPPESIPGKFRSYIIECAKIRQTNYIKEIDKINEETNLPISHLDKMWDGRDLPDNVKIDNLKFLARLTLGPHATRQEIAKADRQIKKHKNTRRAYFKKQQKLKNLGEQQNDKTPPQQ